MMPKAAWKEHDRRAEGVEPLLRRGTSTLIRIESDQILFEVGQPADSLYYLHTGTIKANALSKAGKSAVFLLLGPGQFFGESCLLENTARAAGATALTPCLVERIGLPTLWRALREDTGFAKKFLEHLAWRNRQLLGELSNHFFFSTEKRLARALLQVANIQKQPTAGAPHVGQEMLAEMISSTRSRVNFFMNKFRRLGLIEYSDTIVVRGSFARILGET
jgi:CRP/FNR family transcriptional regulator, cyclic AMP receptor protein